LKGENNDIGPQSGSGTTYARKARLHQSLYRAFVLKQPCGKGPTKNSNTFYGNMLVKGEATGANFLTPEIFEYAKKRVAEKLLEETIEPYRLFNNMLSSQPMCFNLFVPLMFAAERGEEWVTSVIDSLFPQRNIEWVESVRIEFIPLPASVYTGDKSAFDAFVEYRSLDGSTGIIGIETKYTDRLGKNPGSNLPRALESARNSKCFTSGGMEMLEKGASQIARNFLLTEAYRMRHGMSASLSLVLSPAEDVSGVKEIEQFKMHLNEEGRSRISHLSLERFVEAVQQHTTIARRAWINEFERRYVKIGAI